MPSTQPNPLSVALESLRRPIQAFTPGRPSDECFQVSMLALSDQLEELWGEDEVEALESDIVWMALYAVPALTTPGPTPEELVELAASGDLMDADTADTLRTLKKIRVILLAFEPPGFAAALWRAMLLAIFDVIELFVLIDDERNTARCFELLDTAEAMADRFSGKA